MSTASISLHGKAISSVFELLGAKENDITYSLGWAIAHCPEYRKRVVAAALRTTEHASTDSVVLQDADDHGITDIEIKGPDTHIVFEAKRAFELPDTEQLGRYARRLLASPVRHRVVVTVSQASAAFAATRLPPTVEGLPCVHLSLADLNTMSKVRTGSHAEKRLLGELSVYLKRISHMQDVTSNLVYVVALSHQRPLGSDITWAEIVELHGKYFHPVGGAYPREPVNYLGFRYGGQLRAIRHTESCEIVADLADRIPGCKHQLEGPHYLYTLGPAIVPSKQVKNGTVVMANRLYAAIDLLLTCDTISDAGRLTRQRLGEE